MGAITFGLIAALAWGIHDILVRYVSQSLGILVSLISVLIFGILAQLPMVLIFGELENIDREAIWYSVAAGITFSVACIGHYNAFKRGPVRIVAPLIGCYSILSFIIAAALGSQVSLAQWGVLALLILGIALVARSSSQEATDDEAYPLPATLGYCCLAILGFSFTFSLGHLASSGSDPLVSGLITRAVTTVIIIGVLFLTLRISSTSYTWPHGKVLITLALMGTLDAIALGVVLAAGVFERPEFASASSSIFGLVTVILAWAFMREKISQLQWVGIFMVFAAIAYLAI